MYVLVTTGRFDRRALKFIQAHPELKKLLARALIVFPVTLLAEPASNTSAPLAFLIPHSTLIM